VTGRKTLAEVSEELESAFAKKLDSPSPVAAALKRVLESAVHQSPSHSVEERPAESDSNDSSDQMVGH
jgi:hypothetical protein